MLTVENYPNKAAKTAFIRGQIARKNGEKRVDPYGCENRSSADFRRAWLAGYDSVENNTNFRKLCERLVDAMRRCDPDDPRIVADPSTACFDDEWDSLLAEASKALADVGGAN